MSEQEIIACPKCGVENIETPTYWTDPSQKWGVQCLSCGHEVEGADSLPDARAKWNAQ